MRFATYLKDGSPVVGVVDDDDKSVRALHRRSDGRPVRDLADVIAGWPAAAEELSPDGDPEALDLVRLLPPLRTGRNIICVGRNYRDHATEFSQSGFDASDPAAILLGKFNRIYGVPGKGGPRVSNYQGRYGFILD